MTAASAVRVGKRQVDGLLLLNKPAGITSNRALQAAKRWLGAKKAGHTGSLDPAATGMLPLCFGEATKVCAYLLDADKTYRVVAELGTATDTGDADGVPIDTQSVPALSAAAWQERMSAFIGDSEQVPPMYSALKQGGKRLYELARQGETVERPPRPIRIDEMALLEVHGKRLVFRVRCSKGTYVRTLVEDLAKSAGTVAHTAFLHRERVGCFEASEMVDFAELESAAERDPEGVLTRLLPIDRALIERPAVRLNEAQTQAFCCGQPVVTQPEAAGLVRVYGENDRLLGLGDRQSGGQVAPRRLFRLAPGG